MTSESDSQNRSIVLLRRVGRLRERHAEQHGEEHDLQHFVVRRRLEEAVRHDVLEHIRDASPGVAASSLPGASDAAVMFTPTPGFTKFTAISPTASASVVTTSK